ncbi:MAG: hypothetical protein K0Q79_327 [Flavipsychrobacter sp.]|jgi:uncharacterized metal-binding protein YceD (DUF177 family)|nr:hypothetical protein [Flavipsychrobacter sp.]
MKHNREFEIAWQGLKPGPHTYVYDIDDRFIQERGEVDDSFKNWNAKVTLGFDKHESFFMLHFDIDGYVTVPCDRCGDEFKLRLWDEFDLVIKLTDEAGKIDDEDDVVFIPRSETVIDISNWVYEFLMLSVPLQHIHPDKPDGKPGCNAQALKLLEKLKEPSEPVKNPMWKEQLEKFKEVKGKKTKPKSK